MSMKICLINNRMTKLTCSCTVHGMLVIFKKIFRDILATFWTWLSCVEVGNMLVKFGLHQ